MPQPHPQKPADLFCALFVRKSTIRPGEAGRHGVGDWDWLRSIGYREMGLLCMFFVASIDFFSVLVRPPAKEQKNDGI